jgi:hypothetical protein
VQLRRRAVRHGCWRVMVLRCSCLPCMHACMAGGTSPRCDLHPAAASRSSTENSYQCFDMPCMVAWVGRGTPCMLQKHGNSPNRPLLPRAHSSCCCCRRGQLEKHSASVCASRCARQQSGLSRDSCGHDVRMCTLRRNGSLLVLFQRGGARVRVGGWGAQRKAGGAVCYRTATSHTTRKGCQVCVVLGGGGRGGVQGCVHSCMSRLHLGSCGACRQPRPPQCLVLARAC